MCEMLFREVGDRVTFKGEQANAQALGFEGLLF